MERKNLLFIKNNCDLSSKLISQVGETYKLVNVNEIKLPDELKNCEIPFIIVKNIIKPIEGQQAIIYLENEKFFNQQTNNITKKIIQMKPIVNELDKTGINKEFNKISDEYTFIEDGQNIEKLHRNFDTIDDSKKIDIVTDFNADKKLDAKSTADQVKQMVSNRNKQLAMHLRGRK
jgi:hypothetical protein